MKLALLLALGWSATARADRVPGTETLRLYEEGRRLTADARRIRDGGDGAEARELFEKARGELAEALKRDPAFTRAAVALGEALLELDRSAEAVEPLEKALLVAPNDPSIKQLLGIHLFRLRKVERGTRLLEEVSRELPGRFDVHYLLAGQYYKDGRDEDALRHAKAYLDVRGGDAAVHGMVGNIHLRKGRLEDAVRSFRRVLEIDPQNVPVRVNLGNVFYQLKDYAKAIDAYERVVQKQPDLALLHYNLGSSYYALGRFEEAARRFVAFVRLEPNHAAGHYYGGAALARLRRDEEAIPLLARATALDPKDPWAPYTLARIARRRGELGEAQTAVAQALSRQPDSERILLLAGVIARQRGDTSSAVRLLLRASTMAPRSALVRAELGYARVLAGLTDTGIDDLEAARTLDGKEPRVLLWLPVARTRRAVASLGAGETAAAEADLRRALEIQPGLGDAAYDLALLRDAQGDSKGGILVVQAALNRSPSDPNLHLAAAWLLVRLGRADSAQGELQRAQGAADAGLRWLVQAAVHGAFGEFDAAIAAFKEAKDRGVDAGPAVAMARLDRAASLLGRGQAAAAASELRRMGGQLDPPEARVRAALLALALLTLDSGHAEAPELLAAVASGPAPQGWGIEAIHRDADLLSGYVRYRLGQGERALEALERHVAAEPDDRVGRRLLAVVLADLAERDHAARRYAAAAKKAERALGLTDEDSRLRHNLACIRYGQGEHAEAAATFRALLDGVPEARLNLALYLDDVAGRGSEALAHYRRYVAANGLAAEVARRRIERKERIFGP